MKAHPLTRTIAIVVVAAFGLTGCLDPTTGEPPSPGAAAPAFRSSVGRVTVQSLGSSWRPGCPVGPDDLRSVQVSHWGYDGTVRTGRLIVHRSVAADLVNVFRQLYARRFQIRTMQPVTAFGSSDTRSMEANNTSAFNCRRVAGGTGWSEHAYGKAVDLNPIQNPYISGSTLLPSNAGPWRDRKVRVPGMVHAGDSTVTAFASIGWHWGGQWRSLKDYQHFSSSGR